MAYHTQENSKIYRSVIERLKKLRVSCKDEYESLTCMINHLESQLIWYE